MEERTYGDIYVTSVTPETHYVWRTIKRSEYRNIVKELERRVSSGDQFPRLKPLWTMKRCYAGTCILFPKIDLLSDDIWLA
jgi:hypothetical protein